MREKRKVAVGRVIIGGDAKVSVQSMTNTATADFDSTLSQIRELERAGCDIIRLAVCNNDDLASCRKLVKEAKAPLVADIQFDWKLAAACSELGFKKVRFNPGNIGSNENVRKLTEVCKANGTPIRIGVNGGSLQKDIELKYGRTAEGLCESALCHAALLEKFGFYDIVLSVKSSNVKTCTQAYRLLNEKCDYPLHLGITESGAKLAGIVKSSIGIGSLLLDGIGNTIRVSLTGNPVQEAEVANKILGALGLKKNCEIISCPTCSRCKVNLSAIYDEVEAMLENVALPLKVAVMGCVVNGPGEAAEADFGVAGGEGKSVIFSRGKILKTVSNENIVAELKKLLDEHISENS
ncbi:MAG: flavodoxin-dependent (E)-4-hydroxy-3-methylbut-2-enyl-diphosphate synthase [Clostridia bacterium]|nr:flavodoxin-dependent (E)-4-hydroxy-3-methylbut-2-enyl-diphosphate synthase [Clostridia bacterium]